MIGGLCLPTDIDLPEVRQEPRSGYPIQIVSPRNHSFDLNLSEVRQILQHDNIKDRNVVIVSLAGALRKGKSFLLNFYLRYLEAQVSKGTVLLFFV